MSLSFTTSQASDFRIHDVVETGVRPLALFPMSNQLAAAKDINRRLDSEIEGAEREPEIELSDSDMRCELPNNGGQVKLFGYAVHAHQSV